VEVVLTHRKGGDGAVNARQDVFTKRIRLTGPALTPEQHAKLTEIAAKCPVQRTLEGTPLIRTLEAPE
jgi:putative redox protein